MSFHSVKSQHMPVSTLYVGEQDDTSSVEAPVEEWSSMLFKHSDDEDKRALEQKGLYCAGSGEICGKYIPMSDSAIFRHPYFSYPALTDPGIKEALFNPEEKKTYPLDGRELYLATCKEMNIAPVNLFYKGLLNPIIDLKYYNVNPKGVRAMAIALNHNKYVKVLDLTDNFLNNEACWHLGEMLKENCTLEELNLSRCKIGPDGLKRILLGVQYNKYLKSLNLSKNEIGDDGAWYIADAIFYGCSVGTLNLSHNNLGAKTASAFTDAFQVNNRLTALDMSWNILNTAPVTVSNFLRILADNHYIERLNLSWNGLSNPRLGLALKDLLVGAQTLKHLDLSYNKFTEEALTNMIAGLHKAKQLQTLDLSCNPMNPIDAYHILTKVKRLKHLKNLLLENILVGDDFIHELERSKLRKRVNIKYGYHLKTFVSTTDGYKEILLKRADFLSRKNKKRTVDLVLLVQRLIKDNVKVITAAELKRLVKAEGASLDDDLLNEFANVFCASRKGKEILMNLTEVADYMRRLWPERKLPPTPPLSETDASLLPKPNTKPTKKTKKAKKK